MPCLNRPVLRRLPAPALVFTVRDTSAFSYANSVDNIRAAMERIGTLLLDLKR